MGITENHQDKGVIIILCVAMMFGKPIAKEDHIQLGAYLGSKKFAELCPLLIKAHPKPVYNSADA